jgi:hypothetical protein
MSRLKFSGHETFIVRTFWPKKGYDFLIEGGNFTSDDAVVDLGVGKNMVTSISFWMKALGLVDETTNELTDFAHFLFDDETGCDPYLEDIGSIWLLHYYLVKTNYSSIYNLVFNELRKERSIFNKRQLTSFILRKLSENKENGYNQNTIEKDIAVFIRLYNRVDYKAVSKDFEDEINSLMIDIALITSTIEEEIKEGSNKKEKVEWYYLHGDTRNNLPPAILLFSIIDSFNNAKNIAVKRLDIESNGPGMIFLMNPNALNEKLKELESLYPGVILSETAGNVILVLPDEIDKWGILRNYYGN